MANLPESSTWEAGIYQIEVTDPVIGGVSGIANSQAKQLANRTTYLKEHVDALEADATSTATTIAGIQSDITDLQSNDAAIEARILAAEGALSQVKQGVVACREDPDQYNFFSAAEDGFGFKTVNVYASSTQPFIACISLGFDATGQKFKYIRATSSIIGTNSFFNASGYIAVLRTDGTLSVNNFVSYTVSYTAPSSPANNAMWYSLAAQRLYRYSTGTSTWDTYDGLVIGWIEHTVVAGPMNVTYYPTIGVGIMDLHGKNLVPAGTVHTFAGAVSAIPPGYLACNGGEISRTTYSGLFRAIGTTYGAGNGTTTFNIPDLRAEFVRGLDSGRGIDSGRTLGSAQTDAFKSHVHELTAGDVNLQYSVTPDVNDSGRTGVASGINTLATGGTETRPRNIAMNFIIKY